MSYIGFKVTELRKVLDANFVKRTPPFGAQNAIFIPNTHFLYYHIEGKRKFGYNGKIYELQPQTILFFYFESEYISFPPGGAYKAMNARFEAIPEDCLFSEKERPRMSDKILKLPFATYLKNDSNLRFLFEDMIYCAMSSQRLNNLKAQLLLAELLTEVAKINQRHMGDIPSFVEMAVNLIERRPEKAWTLNELTQAVNTSPATLTRHFSQTIGKSIRQFHLDKKVKQAMAIMRNDPDVKFKEIAEMLNFYDEYHFSKCFKSKTGVSPLKYKRKIHNATVRQPRRAQGNYA